MSFASYLRSSLPMLIVMLGVEALCGFILVVGGVRIELSIMVCCMVAAATLLVLAGDYLRKRTFYGDLDAAASEVEHPLWLSEMIERPDYAEGAIAYDALRAISKAANDDIAEHRRQSTEYREYIETWVHEAKSPLAAAHLMVENIEDELLTVGDEPVDAALLVDRVRAIDEELDRMEGYVEQALFFARSETVDRDYLIREYNLKELVSAALRANSHMLISAQVAPFRRDLDFQVFTDEKWMLFIIGQIIQNSVKYARSDGAFIEFSGSLRDEGLSSERVELAIRDNGCGVSPADLPRVFEKGFTGAAGRTGKRSTGIGLYLVERLCSKMGVGIEADSAQGQWFQITLSFSTNRFHYFE